MRTILRIGKRAELANPPAGMRQKIRQALTLPNPEFVQAKKQGRHTGHLDPDLIFYEETGNQSLRRKQRPERELLRKLQIYNDCHKRTAGKGL